MANGARTRWRRLSSTWLMLMRSWLRRRSRSTCLWIRSTGEGAGEARGAGHLGDADRLAGLDDVAGDALAARELEAREDARADPGGGVEAELPGSLVAEDQRSRLGPDRRAREGDGLGEHRVEVE